MQRHWTMIMALTVGLGFGFLPVPGPPTFSPAFHHTTEHMQTHSRVNSPHNSIEESLKPAQGLGSSNAAVSKSTLPKSAAEIDTMRKKIPWGITQAEMISMLGAPDVKEPEIIGYAVRMEDISMMLGYHFNEQDELMAMSLVYPKPPTPANAVSSGTDQAVMTLVSEYGQPDTYTEAEKAPIWKLDDETILAIFTGEDTQTLLLIRTDAATGAEVSPKTSLPPDSQVSVKDRDLI